jgi:uncharacterized protein (TIGR00661 family)
MARILFGIMGDARGHISQALSLEEEMPGHEFLFVGGQKVLELLETGRRVVEVPVPSTYYCNNRIDLFTTIGNAVTVFLKQRKTLEKILQIIDTFKPDIVLTAYEYFTPIAARKANIPCFSIDNQHIITKSGFLPVKGEILGRMLFELPLRLMFTKSDFYYINSFFHLNPKKTEDTKVFPPLLSPQLKDITPGPGKHTLVYQTSSTFKKLISTLEQRENKYIIYGFNRQEKINNLVFKKSSKNNFLLDLASCNYLISNGGHNAISEALYLGKPVLSFPVHYAYEQFVNAFMLKKMGYGDYSLSSCPSRSLLENFEQNLDTYKEKIAKGNFFGNGKMALALNTYLQTR